MCMQKIFNQCRLLYLNMYVKYNFLWEINQNKPKILFGGPRPRAVLAVCCTEANCLRCGVQRTKGPSPCSLCFRVAKIFPCEFFSVLLLIDFHVAIVFFRVAANRFPCCYCFSVLLPCCFRVPPTFRGAIMVSSMLQLVYVSIATYLIISTGQGFS